MQSSGWGSQHCNDICCMDLREDVCAKDICSVDIINDIPMGEPPQGAEGQPTVRAAISNMHCNLGQVPVLPIFYRADEQRLPFCEKDLWVNCVCWGGDPNGLKISETCTVRLGQHSPILTVLLCLCPGDLKDWPNFTILCVAHAPHSIYH